MKNKWQQIIPGLIYGVLGAVCAKIMLSAMGGPERFFPVLAVTMLVLVAAILVQLILHEAGHLVFGLLSGYRFSSFRVFSLMWVREEGKLRLRKLSLAGTAGQCLMAPPDLTDGDMPVVLYNMGGCLMNLLTALVFGLLTLALGGHPVARGCLWVFAATGVCLALVNGLPLHLGPVDNDGCNTRSLRKSPRARAAFWTQMKVAEAETRGLRLRDMPEEWFRFPSDQEMQNSIVAVEGVFACNRLMDQARFAEADREMARILALDSGIVDLHRRLLLCDRTYLELLGENRKEVLEGFLDAPQRKLMRQMRGYLPVLRTEYALALLRDRDEARAQKLKEQFEKAAKTYPYPNDAQSERELLEAAEARSREGSAS